MENIANKQIKNDYFEDSNEADITPFLLLLYRNKILISFIAIIFFIIGCLYSFTRKRVWEGQFAIVLNSENLKSSIDINPSLKRLAGLAGGKSNDLKTEVGILESPSVLMPIFKYVNNEKKKEKNFSNKEINFSNWKENNLNVDLKKGTSILNISYRDTNKDLILPVLKKMTKVYQIYSSRNTKRSQNLTKKFLQNQIEIFKERSSNSIKSAQEFAIDQDLIYFDYKKGLPDSPTDSPIKNTEIEIIRVKSANQIRKIDLQIEKIENLGDDVDQIQYIANTIPVLVKQGLPDNLEKLEDKLVELKSKYTDVDKDVLQLIEKRNLIIKTIRKRALGILKAERLIAEATMESAMRPKGVLIKYKELIREASRDELTLINLENELRIIELEASKQLDPWELITEPTLLNNPVAPNRKNLALLGLFGGTIIGISSAFYLEKRSGKIFDRQSLENYLESQITETLYLSKVDANDENITFLNEFLRLDSASKISFFPVGNISIKDLEKIKELIIDNKTFKGQNNSRSIIIENKLDKFLAADKKLLIIKLGMVTYEEILILKKRINLNDSSFSGILLLKD